MAILLFAEHDNAALSEQTAKALSAASQISGDIDILVAGKDVASVAEQASKLAGVRSVLVAESDALANHLAENAATLIVSLAADYDTIVAAATANGKNILPRVAAMLDVMQVVRSHGSCRRRNLQTSDLCRQCHRSRAKPRMRKKS